MTLNPILQTEVPLVPSSQSRQSSYCGRWYRYCPGVDNYRESARVFRMLFLSVITGPSSSEISFWKRDNVLFKNTWTFLTINRLSSDIATSCKPLNIANDIFKYYSSKATILSTRCYRVAAYVLFPFIICPVLISVGGLISLLLVTNLLLNLEIASTLKGVTVGILSLLHILVNVLYFLFDVFYLPIVSSRCPDLIKPHGELFKNTVKDILCTIGALSHAVPGILPVFIDLSFSIFGLPSKSGGLPLKVLKFAAEKVPGLSDFLAYGITILFLYADAHKDRVARKKIEQARRENQISLEELENLIVKKEKDFMSKEDKQQYLLLLSEMDPKRSFKAPFMIGFLAYIVSNLISSVVKKVFRQDQIAISIKIGIPTLVFSISQYQAGLHKTVFKAMLKGLTFFRACPISTE